MLTKKININYNESMNQSNQQSIYYNEIDSLRAIAVLGVLFFHLFPTYFSGGFIGVDMFFVISGFVISKTYLTELLNKKITFKTFWLKRIRRLMPVYFVVIFVASIAVYFILEPHLLKSYGKSLIYQPLYIQNFIFWFEGSYFNRAITKPLLHTWSLGVEEQFYVFFVLIIVFSKNTLRRFAFIFTLLALFSIIVGYIIALVSPKTAFYLLPMRIWEFYLGIACFLMLDKYKIKLSGIWSQIIYLLVLILVSSFILFNEKSIFPGLHSIIACITVFICISIIVRQTSGFNYLLANRTLQFIGKISYSLYLWHWVIISIIVNFLNRDLAILEAFVVLILSFLLSYLTLILIENPVRKRVLFSSDKKLFLSMLVTSLILLFIGVFYVRSNGASFRYEEPYKTWLETAQQKSPYRCSILKRITDFNSEICKINSVDKKNTEGILLIGDSHMDQLDEMIAKLGTENNRPVYLTVRNCKIDEYSQKRHCNKNVFKKVLNEIELHNIRTVITASFWENKDIEYKKFENSIDSLIKLNVKIFISEVVPHTSMFNPIVRTQKMMAGEKIKHLSRKKYESSIIKQRQVFSLLKEKYSKSIEIISPEDVFCSNNYCYYSEGKFPFYIDDNHLSYYGVSQIKSLYLNIFKNEL
jgi:peptidoglycan/LPS O-acetylase OafA/YrhL